MVLSSLLPEAGKDIELPLAGGREGMVELPLAGGRERGCKARGLRPDNLNYNEPFQIRTGTSSIDNRVLYLLS